MTYNFPDIEVGQLWRDLDYINWYDTKPDGSKVTSDYFGPLSQRPRIVRVEEVTDEKITVRTLHNGRVTKVQRKAFFSSAYNRRGSKRQRGFVREES